MNFSQTTIKVVLINNKALVNYIINIIHTLYFKLLGLSSTSNFLLDNCCFWLALYFLHLKCFCFSWVYQDTLYNFIAPYQDVNFSIIPQPYVIILLQRALWALLILINLGRRVFSKKSSLQGYDWNCISYPFAKIDSSFGVI